MDLNLKTELSYKDHFSFIRNQLWKITDLELLLLKGHILIEYSLNTALEILGANGSIVNDKKFTFDDKIILADLVGLGLVKQEGIIEQIKTINKMRNQIAHSLTFDHLLLNNIYKHHTKELQEKVDRRADTFEQERQKLRYVIGYICGVVLARADMNARIHNHVVNSITTDRANEILAELDEYVKILPEKIRSEFDETDLQKER